MRDYILLKHVAGNIDTLKNDIKKATEDGLYCITLLIETVWGSFDTVSATYYNDFGDELYMLDHNSCNFTLEDIKRYAVLKVDKD